MLVIKLADLFDVLHELGKLFELRPLRVDLVNRLVDLDLFFDMRHTA